MGQVLVRGLDDSVIERLRQRAESHHRSLEAELREILEQVSRQVDVATARDLADRIRSRLEGRLHSGRRYISEKRSCRQMAGRFFVD
jgi:plasmid stability protein